MKKVIILFAIISFSFGDTIYMIDGQKFIGKIKKQTESIVIIQTIDGEIKIPNSTIAKIDQEYSVIEETKSDKTPPQDNNNMRIGINSGLKGISASSSGTTYAYSYSPQFGVNFDYVIKFEGTKILVGGIYYLGSVISYAGATINSNYGISDIHVNFEKPIMEKLSIGGGLNYSIFHGDITSVISGIGYQAFVFYQFNSYFYTTLGYTTYYGSTNFPSKILSNGLVFQAGYNF